MSELNGGQILELVFPAHLMEEETTGALVEHLRGLSDIVDKMVLETPRDVLFEFYDELLDVSEYLVKSEGRIFPEIGLEIAALAVAQGALVKRAQNAMYTFDRRTSEGLQLSILQAQTLVNEKEIDEDEYENCSATIQDHRAWIAECFFNAARHLTPGSPETLDWHHRTNRKMRAVGDYDLYSYCNLLIDLAGAAVGDDQKHPGALKLTEDCYDDIVMTYGQVVEEGVACGKTENVEQFLGELILLDTEMMATFPDLPSLALRGEAALVNHIRMLDGINPEYGQSILCEIRDKIKAQDAEADSGRVLTVMAQYIKPESSAVRPDHEKPLNYASPKDISPACLPG